MANRDHRGLASLLGRQHGVVSLAQLGELGFTHGYAEAQLAARRWQTVHRGVYCGYTGPLARETTCVAALLHCGPGALLDGATAADIHGLVGYGDRRIHVVIPHRRRITRRPGLHVRRSRTLTERSSQTRNGMAMVRVDRALLTMALLLPRRAQHILTAGVQQGLTTAVRLRGTLLGLGRVQGRVAISRVIDDIEGGIRSGLERLFARVCRRAGLPAPARNHELSIAGRRLFLDVCYVGLRIAIEIDGRAYHLMSEDWEDDLARQNDIVLDGWLVLRFTARELRKRPDHVVAQVRAALERRSRELALLSA